MLGQISKIILDSFGIHDEFRTFDLYLTEDELDRFWAEMAIKPQYFIIPKEYVNKSVTYPITLRGFNSSNVTLHKIDSNE